MIKNKKSQAILVSIMLSVMVLILVVILSTPLREEISKARNSTNLNASNPNISIENKAAVIVLDIGLFYYIGILIAASIAYVTGKRNFTGAITAIVVFMVVSVIITPIKDFIILARDSSHLDCTNAAITVGGKLSCIIVDIWLFYFFIACISAAISYIFVTKAIPKIKGEQ